MDVEEEMKAAVRIEEIRESVAIVVCSVLTYAIALG